ncbi:Spindle pole body-associated protein VIK1 [Nakaseomyces bracarensis]|uniref:Spindle pole body-associated protein VIK1 n=1 Tax=Nakaseomyces bracarensis TaxID=273131 RepID=A0ABR4NRF3_9SACH
MRRGSKLANITNTAGNQKWSTEEIKHDAIDRGYKRRQLNQLIRENEKYVRTDKNLQIKIDKYQKKDIPNIKYEIQKRLSLIDQLDKSASNINESFEKIEKIKSYFADECLSEINKLKTAHMEEIDKTESKLNSTIKETEDAWLSKIEELENMQPEEELLEDITRLKNDLEKKKGDLESQYSDHKHQIDQYKNDLYIKLTEFKTEKSKSLEKVIEEQHELVNVRDTFERKKKELEEKLKNVKGECDQSYDTISGIKGKLADIEKILSPLESEFWEIGKDYITIENEIAQMKADAVNHEQTYNEVYDSLDNELNRRRRLLNSITELKGNSRLFANIVEDKISEKLVVNYTDESIKDMKQNSIYKFTKLIRSYSHQNKNPFKEDLKIYLDFCLKRKENFNLISVASAPVNELYDNLISFFKENYFNDYIITLQYVLLSDIGDSKDLLSKNQLDNQEIELKLKIEEHAISVGSKLETLEDAYERHKFGISQDLLKDNTGIGFSRFQFFSINEPEAVPIDFYFIEIYHRSVFSTLQKSIEKDVVLTSPLEIVFKKLFCDTKSAFIFQIDRNSDLDEVLPLSKIVAQIKNPKRKLK